MTGSFKSPVPELTSTIPVPPYVLSGHSNQISTSLFGTISSTSTPISSPTRSPASSSTPSSSAPSPSSTSPRASTATSASANAATQHFSQLWAVGLAGLPFLFLVVLEVERDVECLSLTTTLTPHNPLFTYRVVTKPLQKTMPENDTDEILAEEYSPFRERDLPGGYVTRFDLYRAAWKKCFDRMESMRSFESVHRAYDDILPGLPRVELPKGLGSSTSKGFLADVASRLETNHAEEAEDDDPPPGSHITHLYPSECPNIMSTMKALVTGFVNHPPNGKDVQRKPVTSLASYDIELLKVWYGVLRDSAEGPEPPPQLVVFLHDFEQFDESVVQDMFYICSSYVPQLPLIVVVALVSVLSLLRVDTFTVPSGPTLLERTFFDLRFEPDVMVGPAALDFLTDLFCRHASSVEGALLILQLAHFKHFDEPLTVFVHDELLGKLSDPKGIAFLTSLVSWSFGHQELASNQVGWPVNDVAGLLASIAEARADFRSRLRRFKLAFGVLLRVRKIMLNLGYRTAEVDKTPLEMMSASLRGGLAREGKYLVMMTKSAVPHSLAMTDPPILLRVLRKLSVEKTQILLQDLQSFLDELPGAEGATSTGVADEFGDWLAGYFQLVSPPAATPFIPAKADAGPREHIINLEDLRLWEIWYTGPTPFPSDILNPAPRASVVSALLQPQSFLPVSHNDATPERLPIWKLPDASILFRRYLEAGRMINVYDWYDSFSQAIESQRSHLSRGGDEGSGVDEEEWKMHVQARFMRALHTLDLIGLIKHTGRKADHVMRTVFDMPE
ncbi:origin recognition complex subunit 3 N-terminus-domain-containing protein [Lactarius sanguifluus]|nr:origin recognition complex subunit 3 N-terminus-domain-containing protein [Lactarius sanguifluus]